MPCLYNERYRMRHRMSLLNPTQGDLKRTHTWSKRLVFGLFEVATHSMCPLVATFEAFALKGYG